MQASIDNVKFVQTEDDLICDFDVYIDGKKLEEVLHGFLMVLFGWISTYLMKFMMKFMILLKLIVV